MAKKFTKVASRFRLSGVGLNNLSTVLVSKEAIYLIPSEGAGHAASGAVAGGLLGAAVGAAMDVRGEKKRWEHPLIHDVADLRVRREPGWPGPKKGPIFVIPKRKVTEWSLSKMNGLVVKAADQTAKIDVGLTGQGKASEAMKRFGWNAVKDGAPDADAEDEDEWDDDDGGDEWDEYEDDSAGYEEEHEEEDEWEEERPQRRRPPADRRRDRSAGGVGRSQQHRRRVDRGREHVDAKKKQALITLGVAGGGVLIALIVVFFKVIGGGGNAPAPRPARPERPAPIARNEPVRPVAPAPGQPPGDPVADNNPGPAAQPNGNPQAENPAVAEPPKEPEPMVSANGQLKLLNSWGPLQPSASHLEISPDGKLIVGHQDYKIRVWDDPEAAPLAEWPMRSVRIIKISPDGRHVAVGGSGGFGLYRMEDGQELWKGNARNSEPGAAWSPDGSRVASFQSSDGIEVRTVDGETLWTGRRPGMSSVNAMDFTPDGTILVIVSGGKLQALNADSGQMVDTKELDRGLGSNCRVCAAGKIAFFPNYEATKVFDYSEPPGVVRPGVGPPASIINQLHVSATGSVAGCIKLKTITVWDPATGKTIDELTATSWSPSEFRISPDGRRLLLWMPTGAVQVWEIPATES